MHSLSDARQQLRVAVRSLLRDRIFAIAGVLSIGVAIATNTTMFSVFDAMLRPRIAGAHAEQLYYLRYYGDVRHTLPASAVPEALASALKSYDAVSGYRTESSALTLAIGSRVREARVVHVRPNFFSVVGISPAAGKLSPNPGRDGTSSIVLSDRIAGELFPGGSSPVGVSATVDGAPSVVVGVARQYAAFAGLDADVWVFDDTSRAGAVPVDLIRFRNGFDPRTVNAELSTVAARLALAANEDVRDTRFYAKPIAHQFRAQSMHLALAAGVIAVLLIACTNLGNLQLARGLNRARELALRSALGATRRDLIALLLLETAVMAAAGLVLGLVLTLWSMGLLHAAVPPIAADYVVAPDPSWRMVGAAAAIALVCLLLIGLFPAVRLSLVDLNTLIKSGSGAGKNHRRQRQKYGVLLAAQLGLTLPVVTGAILLARGTLQYEDPNFRKARFFGFDADSVVSAQFQIAARKGTYVRVAPLVATLVGRAKHLPSVSDAGAMVWTSVARSAVARTNASGDATEIPAPLFSYPLITPGYFRSIGFPMERGKDFVEGSYSGSSIVVDRATATFLWPGENPVGQMMKLGALATNEPWLPVSAVVGDHLDPVGRSYRQWLDTLKLSAVYRVITADDSVLAGSKGITVHLYTRAQGNPLVVTAALRHLADDMALTAPPTINWERDRAGVSNTIARGKFLRSLFVAAAAICLMLSIFGVYSIVAQSVAQRRREIALRIFLGGTPRSVLLMILGEGNVYALAGIALGLYLANRTVWWVGVALWGDETGVSNFALAGAVVFVATVVAAAFASARVAWIDPAEALKAE